MNQLQTQSPHFEKIWSIFKLFPTIDEVILFGSWAKGTARPGSDIDLAIKGQSLSITELSQIESAYEKLDLPWKLDLIVYNTIQNQELKEHIERVGIVVYQKNRTFLPVGK